MKSMGAGMVEVAAVQGRLEGNDALILRGAAGLDGNAPTAAAGPSTSTVCDSAECRSSNIRTRTAIARTQNATVAICRCVEPSAGKNHGFSM